MTRDIKEITALLEAKGQGHLADNFDQLSKEEQSEYTVVLENLLSEVDECIESFNRTLAAASDKGKKVDELMTPLEDNQCGSVNKATEEEKARYRTTTFKAISEGKLGILLLAGGQGTRLGVDYPKGMYDVGLPSKKSLFQLQAERILKLQRLAAELTGKEGAIPWYIMTSATTVKPTTDFFVNNGYFGLNKENVVIFQQGTLPCFTFDGKIIRGSKTGLARAPDGNGGLYRALRTEKILEDMKARGVEAVNLYCVDNILVQVGDPLFVGYCLEKGADCANKVLPKSAPHESVGITVKVSGRAQVVEYSEITTTSAERRNADGSLTYSAANICIHYFTREFLEEVVFRKEKELVHHVAKKKIPFLDASNNVVKPTEPNGIKMEKFVFDVFTFAENFVVWECLREEEFAPLKNAEGAKDSTPTYCRDALLARSQKWALAAGLNFIDGDGKKLKQMRSPAAAVEANNNDNNNSNEVVMAEISPLASYAGEGLEKYAGKSLVVPVHLE